MKIYLEVNGLINESIDLKSDVLFYKNVAEAVVKRSESVQLPAEFRVVTDEGAVEYRAVTRSGTLFITETSNTLPTRLLDHSINKVYLTCADPKVNAYKFYQLEPIGDSVKATYGRMGIQRGQAHAPRSFTYPLSVYWIKYFEKIQKGYVDKSDIYCAEPITSNEQLKQRVQKATSKTETAASMLYKRLASWAKQAVEAAKVYVPLSNAIIEESERLLNGMRHSKSVDEFNKNLLDLICTLQRPIPTGDGTGVRKTLAKSEKDFARIIEREDDLIQAMRGLVNGNGLVRTGDFADYGIEVYIATEKQREEVIRHLSDSLKPKVRAIYRVIPKEQKTRFNNYLKKQGNPKVKMLWHGSRNQNWLSIVRNSLSLNPNAIITGKMFGDGLYFAPSAMKSWGYTSYSGTHWAHGNEKTAYMGLYAVAYGNPCDVDTWFSSEDYKRKTISGGYHCLHAHAGTSLKNDEIIFYDENAVLLNYIVEFGD